MNFGKVFKNTRESLGLNQRTLAARLGITPVALWKIESGKARPRWGTMVKFLKEADLSWAELFIGAMERGDFQPLKKEE